MMPEHYLAQPLGDCSRNFQNFIVDSAESAVTLKQPNSTKSQPKHLNRQCTILHDRAPFYTRLYIKYPLTQPSLHQSIEKFVNSPFRGGVKYSHFQRRPPRHCGERGKSTVLSLRKRNDGKKLFKTSYQCFYSRLSTLLRAGSGVLSRSEQLENGQFLFLRQSCMQTCRRKK